MFVPSVLNHLMVSVCNSFTDPNDPQDFLASKVRGVAGDVMKVTYDRETDSLVITLREAPIEESDEVPPGRDRRLWGGRGRDPLRGAARLTSRRGRRADPIHHHRPTLTDVNCDAARHFCARPRMCCPMYMRAIQRRQCRNTPASQYLGSSPDQGNICDYATDTAATSSPITGVFVGSVL